jgi:hypothetical protein
MRTRRNRVRFNLLIAAGLLAGLYPASGDVGDTVVVDFNRDMTVNKQPGNPAGYRDTPMVTLGGVAGYQNPWEVMVAWNSAAGPGLETQNYGGDGTVTFDQIPPLPAGQYHVFFNMNVANWNIGSQVGLQLGGQGVTELGNENPGAMHYFYPSANPGAADPVNDMQFAGPDMGPGSEYMVNSSGTPITFESNGTMMPAGSKPAGFNDGNSFATSVLLAPGNQIVLTMHDGAAVSFSHIRGFSMKFLRVAPYFTDFVGVSVNDAGAICFTTSPGMDYGLQYTTDLVTTTGWVNVGATLTASATTSYLFDPTEPTGSDIVNKLYRVVIQ